MKRTRARRPPPPSLALRRLRRRRRRVGDGQRRRVHARRATSRWSSRSAPAAAATCAGRAMAAGLRGGQRRDSTSTWRTATAARAPSATPTSSAESGNPEYLLATETALLALPLSGEVEFDYTRLHADHEGRRRLHPAWSSTPTAPYETCADVVEAAKSERVVAGISGATGLDNVVFTLTEQADRTSSSTGCPSSPAASCTAALLGGQIDIASLNPGEVIGQLESGELKALCAYAEERYDYPSSRTSRPPSEQGIDVAFAQFRGVLAPGGISDAATAVLDRAPWRRVVETDEYQQYVEEQLPAAEHGLR